MLAWTLCGIDLPDGAELPEDAEEVTAAEKLPREPSGPGSGQGTAGGARQRRPSGPGNADDLAPLGRRSIEEARRGKCDGLQVTRQDGRGTPIHRTHPI